jgi:hypothetical protein
MKTTEPLTDAQFQALTSTERLDVLRKIADGKFESYDFGDYTVATSNGWESEVDCESAKTSMRKVVFFYAEDSRDESIRGVLAIDFNGTEIVRLALEGISGFESDSDIG